jgi:capsule biosynthesis phosphatase
MIAFEKVMVFDIDGTICPIRGKSEKYEDLVPFESMIKRIREYKTLGFRIVFDTARNMGTYQGNLGEINAFTLPKIIKWLDKWEIPYDEIYVGKPWPSGSFVVDDKAVRPNEFLTMPYEQLLELTGQKNEI